VDVHPAKRGLDLVLGSTLLLLASPLMAVIAALIRLDSSGPAIFTQRRVGRAGREFTLLKFRSMCVDAESQLSGLAHINAGGSQLIRIKNDPRVTRVGAMLRRTSLDELPQFVNVIRGDMSLVGPRPQSPSEVALYTPTQRRRLSVPPGITGLWQVTSRDDPSFDEWVRLDLEYIDHWNLVSDLRILGATPIVVLRSARRRTGAIG
jgi:lipopolysaccharide/colanic/teichoic acid biosynthesis glycosyltransferase